PPLPPLPKGGSARTPCGLGEFDRRRLLKLSGLGSLCLPGLLQALQTHAAAGQSPALPPIRSCILIFNYGGPSQLETWDLKPHAPAEVRGEFHPISTSVPGLSICEHLPR